MHSQTLVVTPVYCTRENQRLPLLLQSLYWVQQQSNPDFMHVVVDDGSTDETPELLDRLAARNERLLVYHQPNKGSSAAVNFGVEQALKRCNPEFITVTHSDDVLTPKSLEMRVDAAKKHRAKFVYGDAIILRETPPIGASYYPSLHSPTSAQLYNCLLHRRDLPYPTMFWRRDFFVDAVEGYDPSLRSAEDWDIALRSAKALDQKGDRYTELSSVTAFSRQHEHNLWKENVSNGTRKRCVHAILAKHLKGWAYQSEVMKRGIQKSVMLARYHLPESVKLPLRVIKRSFFPPEERIALESEDYSFLEMMKSVNYQEYFAQALA